MQVKHKMNKYTLLFLLVLLKFNLLAQSNSTWVKSTDGTNYPSEVMNYMTLVSQDTIISFSPLYYNYQLSSYRNILVYGDSLVLVNKYGERDYKWSLPTFAGGIDSLDKYIYKKLNYPKEAFALKKEGIVDVYCKITKHGKVDNIKIGDFYGWGCGDEATKLFRGMTQWTPAYEDGKPVDFSIHWQIKFALINDKPITYEQFKQQQTLQKANNVNDIAVVQLKEQKITSALCNFSQAIAIHPTYVEAYYNRGICKGKLADKDGACADWNKSLELGGRDWGHFAAKACK